MALNLANYEVKAQEAIKAFWGNRELARIKQQEAGKIDQGERSSVTAGKNLDGFISLILDVIKANGLSEVDIHRKRSLVVLPGYYRPTKLWDLLVVHKGRLVAAIELKSQVGPSFGKNYNNRTEEAIGTAQDLWTAFRENAFHQPMEPFLGWLMVVEEAKGSTKPISDKSPHFPIDDAFVGASYLKRYDVLCHRLMKERLYTAASVITTQRSAISTGEYSELSESTGLRKFVASLAARVAEEVAHS